MRERARVLVTGATGYVGGRLVPRLIEAGHDVVCLARDPSKLDSEPWREHVSVVKGDLLEADTLAASLEGCDYAFYLVHSMDGGDFGERDRQSASNFTTAASGKSLRRIVYLGGLGEGSLSPHLESRQEVGRILASGDTPVTELRAAVVIGSGSVSFEMLRYLTEVLPIMVTPRWVRTMCQPIAIRDVLEVLVAALDDVDGSHVREIGGPDRLSYEEMMRIYAEVAGLPRRLIFAVPLLTPRLSSLWIGLVTPLPTGVARPLVESLSVEVTVTDNSFASKAAAPLTGYREAVARALQRSQELEVPTRWSGVAYWPALPYPSDPDWAGGTEYTDVQEVETSAPGDDLWWAVSQLGGNVGYYTMNWAWRIRGVIDSVVGGVGLRRGRRHPVELRKGESVDFWRVVEVDKGASLQLYAEMRLPGDAWLVFEVSPRGSGSHLSQTALFRPRGLWGRVYWWAMFPFHVFIFGRMAQAIATAAEQRAQVTPPAG
ncbi:MAG TPA: SDR family oxidoreductase [Acidimicrobiia bacterium]|nr:SDR family oxidoreductase [Acidimicrobiia bacterium]